MSLTQEQPPTPGMEDDEAQMRRALGLFGGAPRARQDSDRQDQPRVMGGGMLQGGLHRRRFVQDGEVPVTVVRRGEPADSGSGPTSSRLQRVEAALQAETAARDRAERALQEAQAAVQALQTKIGHNELAKNEAVAASGRDRGEIGSLREQFTAMSERAEEAEARVDGLEDDLRALRTELSEERRARRIAERVIQETTAEQPYDESPYEEADPVPAPPRRGRPPLIRPIEPEIEQEPVKWWLMPAKGAVKRR